MQSPPRYSDSTSVFTPARSNRDSVAPVLAQPAPLQSEIVAVDAGTVKVTRGDNNSAAEGATGQRGPSAIIAVALADGDGVSVPLLTSINAGTAHLKFG